MTTLTIKQHTFKNNSVKTITAINYNNNFDTVYRVVMRDSGNIILCDQTFQDLNSAEVLYKSIAINYGREKFMTKQGRLTLYALCCGYIENKVVKHIKIALEQLTDNTILVHSSDYLVRKYFEYNELTKARKFYDSIK